MTGTLAVILHDQVAGTLERGAHGRLRFTYDDGYRSQLGATPLSVSMPTEIPSHPDHVIAPWLWGLLPDSGAVLERWARQFHCSVSPFSLLAAPVGRDCAGAVRFVPPEQLDDALARPGAVTWLDEEGVAQRLRELREDATAWLGRTLTGQFSLAGAQAKTALFYDNGRWGIPTGATPTTHIMKPAISGFQDHDLNEHLCLDAAHRCGLVAVRTRVERFADETAVVVRRYDRVAQGSATARVHQEDLCQALVVPPSQKYQNEGGPGPDAVCKLLRRVVPSRPAEAAVERFADALIWNWIVGGTDAHAKNYSILLGGDQIRLAPLYDVASALPYGTHEKKLEFAMKIGGDYRLDIWRNPWPATAKGLGLDADQLTSRAGELVALATDALHEAASADAVASLRRRLPNALVSLVADRARRCRAVLRSDGAGGS